MFQSHERHQTLFDRLRQPAIARIAGVLGGLAILAGCSNPEVEGEPRIGREAFFAALADAQVLRALAVCADELRGSLKMVPHGQSSADVYYKIGAKRLRTVYRNAIKLAATENIPCEQKGRDGTQTAEVAGQSVKDHDLTSFSIDWMRAAGHCSEVTEGNIKLNQAYDPRLSAVARRDGTIISPSSVDTSMLAAVRAIHTALQHEQKLAEKYQIVCREPIYEDEEPAR